MLLQLNISATFVQFSFYFSNVQMFKANVAIFMLNFDTICQIVARFVRKSRRGLHRAAQRHRVRLARLERHAPLRAEICRNCDKLRVTPSRLRALRVTLHVIRVTFSTRMSH